MLVMLFLTFIVFMYYNSKLMSFIKKFTGELQERLAKTQLNETSPIIDYSNTKINSNSLARYYLEDRISTDNETNSTKSSTTELPTTEESGGGCFDNRVMFIIMFPIYFLYRLTLPKPENKRYILTFIISIAWLATLAFATVSSVEVISKFQQLFIVLT